MDGEPARLAAEVCGGGPGGAPRLRRMGGMEVEMQPEDEARGGRGWSRPLGGPRMFCAFHLFSLFFFLCLAKLG